MLPFRCLISPVLSTESYNRLMRGEPLNDAQRQVLMENKKELSAMKFSEVLATLSATQDLLEREKDEALRAAAKFRDGMKAAQSGADSAHSRKKIAEYRKGALEHMRLAKEKEELLKTVRSNRASLETRSLQIDKADINKTTVDALRAAREYLQVNDGEDTLEEVRRLDREIAALTTDTDDVGSVLSTPVGGAMPVDDDELMEELDLLYPTPMPSARSSTTIGSRAPASVLNPSRPAHAPYLPSRRTAKGNMD